MTTENSPSEQSGQDAGTRPYLSAGVNLAGSGGVAEWDWVVTGRDNALHAPEEWDDPDYEAYDENALTACGLRGWFSIPGVGTRLGASRCERCCAARGFPQGKGSPKNDDACRPLVEARLADASAGSQPRACENPMHRWEGVQTYCASTDDSCGHLKPTGDPTASAGQPSSDGAAGTTADASQGQP